jgi:dTDP-6-deoxy-L-talose 4-dehydrogenase (NAD+)
MPNTPYALAKDMLHKSLRALQATTDFNLIWARLFYMYGEGQDPKSIVPLLDAAIERGDGAFNMSFGEQLFDYLPIEAVARQLTALIPLKNGVFNVCSGAPISLRRLLENRIKEKGAAIALNLGYYPYRKQDTLAIWGLPENIL